MNTVHSGLGCLILVVACSLLGTTAATAGSDQNTDAIRAIRKQYAVIEADAQRYTMRDQDLFGYSTEGGILISYYLGPTVRKLVAHFYGCSFNCVEEFYFDTNRLIFVLITRYDYDQPLGAHILNTPSGNIIRTSHSRFYFNNGQMIRRVEDRGEPTSLDADEVRSEARDMLKHLHEAK